MKMRFLCAGLLLASSAVTQAQESPYVLNRSRIASIAIDTAWKSCVALVEAAPVIVNTIDTGSHLVAFTMPLPPSEVKDLVLDAKDLEKQPLTLHVVIWISTAAQGTRIYVRAVPNGGGFFSHSNGQIERHILDAIEKGEKWMPAHEEAAVQPTFNTSPDQVELASLAVISASKQIVLNASSEDPRVVTMSLMIQSSNLGQYVYKVAKQYYPGAASVTLWFEPSGSGTAIRTRSVIFESGSLTPTPLASNGQVEAAILVSIKKRLSGTVDSKIELGSNYRGKLEFWNVLFGIDGPGKSTDPTQTSVPSPLSRDLPVPMDLAWAAALEVITQTNVIVGADRQAGKLEFVAAHTSQIGTKYSVHRVIVELTSGGGGTQMSLGIPRALETETESEDELRLYSDRIGTDLFIKDRLQWLLDKKGSK